MKESINIQWFPGHMAKARRMMAENMKYVDAVCEIVDARIPYSSRNPDLGDICGDKPRMIILNRCDQADESVTKQWADTFRSSGLTCLVTDSRSGQGTKGFTSAVGEMLADRIAGYAEKGQVGRTIRLMVAGIPNVGKSSFINRVSGRKAAAASDRPGVTRGKQWIRIGSQLELLDTPGVLWPKFESETVGEHLAFTGAVKDDILDRVALAGNLMLLLRERYAGRLTERYRFEPQPDMDGYGLLEAAARKRGYLVRGGDVDLDRMAAALLDEFRGGKLGRVSLETPAMLEEGAET